MPTWKCDSFKKKESSVRYWDNGVENCGLCINWNGDKCKFHEELKEAETYEEDNDDISFSRTNIGGDDGR